MAKGTTQFKPRRVKDEDDRRSFSSDYITLEEGENFKGYALFEADPKKDESGYYEYFEHWDMSAGRKGGSVPCAGEDCPLCEEGDRPRNRAKTLWLVTELAGKQVGKKGEGELRIFNFNGKVIKQFADLRGEDEKIKGRLFRIALLDDRGTYNVMTKTESKKAAEVKEALSNAPDLEQMVTNQLRKNMERLITAAALSDDGDEPDEEPEEPKAKKGGKGKTAKKPEPDEEPWPESSDDLSVTVDEVDEDNFLLVSSDDHEGQVKVWGTPDIDITELDVGDVISISYFTDSEDDYVLDAEPEKAEAEEDEGDESGEGDELPDTIEDEVFVVTEVDAAQETLEVENDDLGLSFTLFFLKGIEVDFDDYPEGTKVTISAEKDAVGDMVATAVPEVVKAKSSKGTKKKGGRK